MLGAERPPTNIFLVLVTIWKGNETIRLHSIKFVMILHQHMQATQTILKYSLLKCYLCLQYAFMALKKELQSLFECILALLFLHNCSIQHGIKIWLSKVSKLRLCTRLHLSTTPIKILQTFFFTGNFHLFSPCICLKKREPCLQIFLSDNLLALWITK